MPKSITGTPRAFVVGHPIAHSRSPMIHGFWLRRYGIEGRYEKIDVAPEHLTDFVKTLREAGFVGGNVTVPHKTAILDLAEADQAARAIGAANTLWFEGDRLRAGNTDAAGFLANLDSQAPGWGDGGGRAVVLGAGGAARAVVYALLGRGFGVDVANRTPVKAEALVRAFGPSVSARAWAELPHLLSKADLLVNTTSLGMTGQPPLRLDLAPLPARAVVTDIVYAPLETELLRQARAGGHRVVDGLGMLLHQAVPGFSRWFGIEPAVTPDLRALLEADLKIPA